MADPFTITADPARNLFHIVMRGHWSLDDISAYKKGLIAAWGTLQGAGCRREDLVALVDAREGGPQSQDFVAQFRERMGRDAFLPRRLATIVTSALLKRQVGRIDLPNQRLFTDEGEALAWLLSPDPDA